MHTILIVEDEHKLSEAVGDYLVSMGYGTRRCADGLSAVRAVEEELPDLIILDVMLPGIDGIEVARRVKRLADVPIIMLTARETEADKLLGLEVGADDYMTKPFSVRELAARVRAVLRRAARSQSAPGTDTITHHGIELDRQKRSVRKDGATIQVTSAQFDLLKMLMQEPGRVFSRAELIEAISGYAYEGYERTIDVHVKNLRKSIESDSAHPVRIITVWGVGYKFQE